MYLNCGENYEDNHTRFIISASTCILKVAKLISEIKKKTLNGIRAHDICDTGTVLDLPTKLSSQLGTGHIVSLKLKFFQALPLQLFKLCIQL